MKHTELRRGQAREMYGQEFVDWMMRGKDRIVLTPSQKLLLERWKLMKQKRLMPFAYEYVYLVGNGRGEFKVGHTRAPRSRLSGLNVGTVDELRIAGLLLVSGQAGRKIERAIHAALDGKRVRGEWFSGDPDEHLTWVSDFARARYGRYLVSLGDAWEGSEPIWQLYVAANKGSAEAEMCRRARSEFMWVLDQTDKGLTVLS